jgi:uncharacterized membrane protein YphA (DoxX/SURF4 family)
MLILGAVLLLSGGLKALDLNLFVRQMQSYGLLIHPQLTALIAWAITALECFLGAALLLDYRPRLVLNLTLFLLVAFTLLTLYAAAQGSVEDCGCFGALFKRTPLEAAVEDGVFLILCVVARRGMRASASKGAWLRALITCGLTLTGIVLPFFSGVPSALLTARPAQGGTIWAELQVQGPDVRDLGQSTYLVVLMSAGCRHCQEAVPEVAMLMDTLQTQPLSVVALAQDSDEDLQAFTAEWAPPYPIGRIDGEAFWNLLEDAELPRFILVKAGRTLRIWDEGVPTAEEVIAALGSGS